MASVHRRPNSRHWRAYFTDRNGRRRSVSTGTTSRKTAEKIANDFEVAARARRTSMQTRKVLTALHEELTGEAVRTVTLRAFVTDWLAQRAPEVAPATLNFYRKSTAKFLAFLVAEADRPLDEITRDHITRFRNAQAKTLAPKTTNHAVKTLRQLFQAARRDGLLAEDPTEFVDVVKDRKAEDGKRTFTLPELRATLDAADDEWRSMVLVSFYTGGQRLADVACLKWSNVDMVRGEIAFVTRKTGRRMRLPMPEPLRAHLAALPASDDPEAPLHPRAFATVQRTGDAGGLSNQFADVLAAAGLREKKAHRATGKGREAPRERSGLSFHCLRHTATTLLHEAGLPANLVQEFVGHEDQETHAGYHHVGRASLERVAAAFPTL